MAERQYGLRATDLRWAVIETGTLTESGYDEVLIITEKKGDADQWRKDNRLKDASRYSVERVQVGVIHRV